MIILGANFECFIEKIAVNICNIANFHYFCIVNERSKGTSESPYFVS